MGGRGSWSATARGEKITGGSNAPSKPSERIPAAQFQTLDGNRVSKSATFASVEAKIAQHTYETGVVVDGDGFVVAAYKGGRNSVNFGSDGHLVKGNIVTHNHPSGAAAFSVADIRSTGNMKGVGIRATTKGNGTAVLRASSNKPQWSKMALAYDRFLKGGKTVKEAQAWLGANAPKYGLKFTLEK